MTPPLSLTIGLELNRPLADQPTRQPGTGPAPQLGQQVAQHLGDDARLILTSGNPEGRQVTWTIAVDPEGRRVGSTLDALEQFAGAVLAGYAEEQLGGEESLDYRVIELQALSYDEVERRLAEPNYPDLVGSDEVAEILGVSRATVYNWQDTDPNFPPAVARGVWIKSTIEVYASKRERSPQGRKPKPKAEDSGQDS